MTRWMCKACRTWGVGGPEAASKHVNSVHGSGRVAASTSFGFVPNYANGHRTRYRDDYVGVPRAEDDPA